MPTYAVDSKRQAMTATGIVQPGSLITWRYRLKLAGNTSLRAARAVTNDAKKQFPDAGWRMTRNSPPGPVW